MGLVICTFGLGLLHFFLLAKGLAAIFTAWDFYIGLVNAIDPITGIGGSVLISGVSCFSHMPAGVTL